MYGLIAPVRPCASWIVATPSSPSNFTAWASGRGMLRTILWGIFNTQGRSGEFAGHLRIHALVSLGVLDSFFPGVPHSLYPAPLGQVAVIIPEMLLRLHRLHGFFFNLVNRSDVEQHLRLELALLGLVRFKDEYRWRAELLAFRRITRCLRIDTRLQRKHVGVRMIGIIGIFVGMRQDYFGLKLAILHHHFVNGFFGSLNRIVAGIEETDLGAQNPSRPLGFLLPLHLHALHRHAGLLPQKLRFTALAERQAKNPYAITLLRVQRDCSARSPYKVGCMGAHYQNAFLGIHK